MSKKLIAGMVTLIIAVFTTIVVVDNQRDTSRELTISFNTNGGNQIQDLVIDYQQGDDLSLPVAEKDGFDFLGWFLNDNLTQAFDESLINDDDRIQVYAKWDYLFDTQSIESSYHMIDEGVVAQGIVYALYEDEGFFIYDDTGMILVKNYQNNISVGDTVLVEGYVSIEAGRHVIDCIYSHTMSNDAVVSFDKRSFNDFIEDNQTIENRYHYGEVEGFLYQVDSTTYFRDLNSGTDIELVNGHMISSDYLSQRISLNLVRMNMANEELKAYVSMDENNHLLDTVYTLDMLSYIPEDLLVDVEVEGTVYHLNHLDGDDYAYIIDGDYRIKVENNAQNIHFGNIVQVAGTFDSSHQVLKEVSDLDVLGQNDAIIDNIPTYTVDVLDSMKEARSETQYQLVFVTGVLKKNIHYHFQTSSDQTLFLETNSMDEFIESSITLKVLITYENDDVHLIDTSDYLRVSDYESLSYDALSPLDHGSHVAYEGYVSFIVEDEDYSYIYLYNGSEYLFVRFDQLVELEIGDYIQVSANLSHHGDVHSMYLYKARVIHDFDNDEYSSEAVIPLNDNAAWDIQDTMGRRYQLSGILLKADEKTYIIDPHSQQMIELYLHDDILSSYDSGMMLDLRIIYHSENQYIYGTIIEADHDVSQTDNLLVQDYYYALNTYFNPEKTCYPYDSIDYFMFLHQHFEHMSYSVNINDQSYFDSSNHHFNLVDQDSPVRFDFTLTYLGTTITLEDTLNVNEIHYLPYDQVYDYDISGDLRYLEGTISAVLDDEIIIINNQKYLSIQTPVDGYEIGDIVIVKLLDVSSDDVPLIYAGPNDIHKVDESAYFSDSLTTYTIDDLINYHSLNIHTVKKSSLSGVFDMTDDGAYLVSENKRLPLYIDDTDSLFFDQYFAKHVSFEAFIMGVKDGRLYIKITDEDKASLIANDLSLEVEVGYIIKRYKESALVAGESSVLFDLLDAYYDEVTYTIDASQEALFDMTTMTFHEVENQETLTLQAQIEDNGNTISIDIEFTLSPVPYTKTTDIQDRSPGDYVYVEGIIRYQYYEIYMIQDEYGVVQLVSGLENNLSVGDSIMVYARVLESGEMLRLSLIGDSYIYEKQTPLNYELETTNLTMDELITYTDLDSMLYMNVEGVLTYGIPSCGNNLVLSYQGLDMCIYNTEFYEDIYQYLGHDLSMNAYIYDYDYNQEDSQLRLFLRIDDTSINSIQTTSVDLEARFQAIQAINELEFFAPFRHVQFFEDLNTYFDTVTIDIETAYEALYDAQNNAFTSISEDTTIEIDITVTYQSESYTQTLEIVLEAYDIINNNQVDDKQMYSIMVVEGYVSQLTDNGFIINDPSGALDIIYDGDISIGDTVIVYIQKIPDEDTYILKAKDTQVRVVD